MDARRVQVDGVGLHVGVTGDGPDVVVLSGGPGCVQYLEREELAPRGCRAWYPEPRGVGRSEGGPHDMEQAIADLEAVRTSAGVQRWTVLGHSWGSDLAVRYALEHPGTVSAVVGIAGRGAQRDRSWSQTYEAGKEREPVVPIDWVPAVHASLNGSYVEWVRSVGLWRGLADCEVPMHLIAAGDDIRPSWPLQQLAALLPHGRFSTVPDVVHDFWSTAPDVWAEVVTEACAGR